MSAKTVLVVDDNPVNRKLASAFLRHLGYEAVEASSGAEALQCLDRSCYRSILLDISMPGLSGHDVLRHIRGKVDCGQQHVVAYTAHAQPEDVESMLAAGFDAVLIKPINLDSLAQVLAGLESS